MNSSTPASSTVATASAIRVHQFGGPEVMKLERVDLEPPAAGQVLLRVVAAGVGPWDGWVRSGNSVLPQPLPLTPGSDVAGVVEVLGDHVVGLAVGDEVYGCTNERFTNGYATKAIVEARMIARKPKTLSFVDAASVPVIAVTAWQMLFDHAALTNGKTVLILGAAGGVGGYAVQLAKNAGIRILASDRHGTEDALRAYGTDVGLVGPLDDLATPLPQNVDAVVDLVGGVAQKRAMETLISGGVLISSVSKPDEERARQLGISARFILVSVNTSVLEQLAEKFDAGQLKVAVGTVLPLDEAIKAHEMLEGRLPKQPGKIVLQVAETS